MLWKYWSDPKLFKKWHGPKIFTCPVSQIDFRVGGKYLHCMKGKEGDFKGKEFWRTGTYKEIIPFKKMSPQILLLTKMAMWYQHHTTAWKISRLR